MTGPDRDRWWDRIEVGDGVDTDDDGLPDTVLLDHSGAIGGELADDLVIAADTDHDGLADLIIEIGPTGGVATTLLPGASPAGESWTGLTLDGRGTDWSTGASGPDSTA